jgi:hypothetical protein
MSVALDPRALSIGIAARYGRLADTGLKISAQGSKLEDAPQQISSVKGHEFSWILRRSVSAFFPLPSQ